MPIDEIAVGNATDNTLTVTLKGPAADVVKVLCEGLSREALVQMNAAVQTELGRRRAAEPTKG